MDVGASQVSGKLPGWSKIPSGDQRHGNPYRPRRRRYYRIATFDPTYNITFNQFLIADDKPALIHTGTWQVYDAVRNAIAKVLDPKRLAYVVIPHFEADECGGMRRFVDAAPAAR
jgi:flavorubredoxin